MSWNTVGGGSWLVHSFTTFVRFQATFEKLENELREVNQNAEALKRNYLELTELKHILRKTQGFFDEVSVKLEFTALCKKNQFYVKLYVAYSIFNLFLFQRYQQLFLLRFCSFIHVKKKLVCNFEQRLNKVLFTLPNSLDLFQLGFLFSNTITGKHSALLFIIQCSCTVQLDLFQFS